MLTPPTFLLSYCVCSQISNLIASEIIRNEDVNARVSAIEKWVAVADICRCLHNYNAVLEITSSMNRSAIFRLKKTWLKVSKQVWAGRGHHCLWGWAGPGQAGGRVSRALAKGQGKASTLRDNREPPLLCHPRPGIRTPGVALGPMGLYVPLE